MNINKTSIARILKDRIVIVVIVLATAIFFNWGWLISHFNFSNQITYSPVTNVQQYIETYVKEEYWPDEYKADKNDWFDIQGFGRRLADNYGMSWGKDGMIFAIAIGDEKGESEKPIGFFMHINIEGKQSLGVDLANRFLKDVPQERWKYSKLKEDFWFTDKTQIASVVWKKGSDSLIVETTYQWYAKPQTGFLPDKAVTEMSYITLRLSTPKDQIGNGDLNDYQSRRLRIYGE